MIIYCVFVSVKLNVTNGDPTYDVRLVQLWPYGIYLESSHSRSRACKRAKLRGAGGDIWNICLRNSEVLMTTESYQLILGDVYCGFCSSVLGTSIRVFAKRSKASTLLPDQSNMDSVLLNGTENAVRMYGSPLISTHSDSVPKTRLYGDCSEWKSK